MGALSPTTRSFRASMQNLRSGRALSRSLRHLAEANRDPGRRPHHPEGSLGNLFPRRPVAWSLESTGRDMTPAAQLKASEVAKRYGFTARHWTRLAAAGKIPGAWQ